MFKYKTQEQLSKMSAAEVDEYTTEKRQHEEKQLDDKLAPLNKTIGEQADTISDLKKSLEEATEKVSILIEAGENGLKTETIAQAVSKHIEDNFDKIKAIQKAGQGLIEFEIKAVETITTASATNPDGIPVLVGVQAAPPTRVNLRTAMTDGLVTNFNTNLAAYPYTESVPKDGDYGFVLEGGLKPQIDFKVETRWATPVKIAAWEHLTEESVKDIPGMQSIATGYLKDRHDLKKQRAILFGTGINGQPTGATLYGRLFTAGALALGVVDPNFMDVVNAAITDVYTTFNYQDETPYLPSLVLINPNDFYLQLVAAKDGFGRPLYPEASLFNRVVIGGVTIYPEMDIPAGKIFVGDMSKYNVSNYVGYVVKIGWINDDFIRNMFVILGESRFHAFVKRLDRQAFIYDDIATIKTAITAPADPA